jgi:hypothetical protein
MNRPNPRTPDARSSILFFVAALAITVSGFWPSFFGILTQASRADLLHGWSATGWLILTVAQACLIGGGRPRLHRSLGYFSLALALLVVVTGFVAVQNQTLRNIEEMRLYRYQFNVSNLIQLVAFTVFLFMGIAAAWRGAIAHHLRFMMGTSLIVLPPAFERLWANLAPALGGDYGVYLYLSIFTVELILAVLIFAEWRRGRMYPQALAVARPVAEATWFQEFSQWFATIQ